jgi:hypothetical protein
MLDISKPHLWLLVSALRDAIRFNERFLESEVIKDISDYEDYMVCLENFAAWVEQEYRRLEKEHPDLMKYDEIVKS